MPKLSKKKRKEIIKKYGKIPTKKEIFRNIMRSQERMVVSLMRAWETAPDDQNIRQELLKAMEKAVNIRENVYKEVIKKEPPDIKDSYKKLKAILDKEVKREMN